MGDGRNAVGATDLRDEEKNCTLLDARKSPQLPNNRQPGRRCLVNALFMMFGISCWIGVNGVFVQLPLLVTLTPEGSSLPVCIVILVQLSNVFSTLYVFLKRFAPRFANDVIWISGLLVVDTTAMGLLAFFYDVRTAINGVEYSVVMLVLVFFVAIIGTCSPVLFLPYLRNFEKSHVIPYFVGQGLGGVIASGLALAQGVGSGSIRPNETQGSNNYDVEGTDRSTPNFTPTIYFSILTAILASSTCAFGLLECSPIVKRERVTESVKEVHRRSEKTALCERNRGIETVQDIGNAAPVSDSRNCDGSYYLCLLMGLVCFVAYGYLPSIQAYSSLPYGNLAYHLVATSAQFADPIACSLAFWLPTPSKVSVTWILSLAFILCSYVTWLAISSPTPPWRDTTQGVALLVLTWVLLTGFISYAKVTIATMFRQRPGNNGLYLIGITSQVGSFCGAIVTFVVVTFVTLFN